MKNVTVAWLLGCSLVLSGCAVLPGDSKAPAGAASAAAQQRPADIAAIQALAQQREQQALAQRQQQALAQQRQAQAAALQRQQQLAAVQRPPAASAPASADAAPESCKKVPVTTSASAMYEPSRAAALALMKTRAGKVCGGAGAAVGEPRCTADRMPVWSKDTGYRPGPEERWSCTTSVQCPDTRLACSVGSTTSAVSRQ